MLARMEPMTPSLDSTGETRDSNAPIRAQSGAAAVVQILRPLHWAKNLLLLLPLLLSHEARNFDLLARVGVAIVCFCLTASAVYIVNDRRDVENDRAHPLKRRRPFAAGTL